MLIFVLAVEWIFTLSDPHKDPILMISSDVTAGANQYSRPGEPRAFLTAGKPSESNESKGTYISQLEVYVSNQSQYLCTHVLYIAEPLYSRHPWDISTD